MNGFNLSDEDVVELVYYMHCQGYISREFHDKAHEILFNMQVHLDNVYGNWKSIEELVKKVREENARINGDVLPSSGNICDTSVVISREPK